MSKHMTDSTTKGGALLHIAQNPTKKSAASVSAQVHNAVMFRQMSKRKKIRITDCDPRNRRDKVRDRLLEKLAAKKKAKSS